MLSHVILSGNFRSALNDVTAARKLKPCHLKAIVRGKSCRTMIVIKEKLALWYQKLRHFKVWSESAKILMKLPYFWNLDVKFLVLINSNMPFKKKKFSRK